MITFDNKIVTYNDKDGMISLTPSTIGDDTYSWQGRRLMSISGTKNIQFEYNEYGLRTFKRVDTGQTLNSNKIYKDYEFVYDLDNKLICQRVTYLNSIDTMIFLYHDDYLYGFEYAQSKYFYLRDSLGNINGIIDSTGKLVVEYVYNAFGKIIDILGEMKDTIGVNNPMRYKGYYYDSETQMYYCKSRYYNPDFCRWISGDSEKYIDTETPLGLNLFVYCNNDPVNKYDPSGHLPKWAAWLFSGAAIVGGIVLCATGVGGILGGVLIGAGAGSLINGYVTEASGGDFTAGYIGGAISGALCGVGAGLGGMAFAAASEVANLACMGYLALGVTASFVGGFAGNLAGTVYTSWHNSGFKSVDIDWGETLATSAIMGSLNILAGMGSAMSSIAGSMGRAATDVTSKFALRFLAGSIAGGTEAAYDLTSYLLGKLISVF